VCQAVKRRTASTRLSFPRQREHFSVDNTTSGIIASLAWTVETLNETVDVELAELPADMRARLIRISALIESVGLPNVKEPHVRHIRGALWEIRLKGKPGSHGRSMSRQGNSAW
jgi:hypothetical protein